jgi:hypothetical protein
MIYRTTYVVLVDLLPSNILLHTFLCIKSQA